MAPAPQSPGLYAQVLGPQWHELADAVRRLHTPGAIIEATGAFRVRRGNWIARIMASLAGLPSQVEAVDLRLTVTPSATSEEWRRAFGARLLISTQWLADGTVAEWMGPSEARFRFQVVDGALLYEVVSTALRLGPLRLWLPRFLAPRVSAVERAVDAAVDVSVHVTLPLLGLLIAYEGRLTHIEVKPC